MAEYKTIKKQDCPHVSEMKIVSSEKKKCEQCNETEHLRICTSCGMVHCCESANSHNKVHFKKSGHPIIKPVHSKYNFTWCYACNAYLE